MRLQAEHVAARSPRDVDVLPEEGGEIEQVRESLLRRIERYRGTALHPRKADRSFPVAPFGSPLAGGWAALWIG